MRVIHEKLQIVENTELLHEIKHLKMRILFMGQAHLTPVWSREEYINNVNHIYLITEGEAEIWCNGHHIKITKGNIYFIPTGAVFAHRCDNECKKLYCKIKLLNSLGEELPIVPPEGLTLTGREAQIEEMVRLYQKTDYRSALALHAAVEGLVAEAMEQGEEQAIRGYSPIIADTLKIIHGEPHLALSATALAQRFSLSAGHLRNQFSKEVGTPIAKYVHKQVLSACEEDLRKQKLTLHEIAAKYGFCDQGHFSRLFTEYCGISPTKYRKHNIV